MVTTEENIHRFICDEIKRTLAVRKGLIRTLSMAPSISVLTRFDCILYFILLHEIFLQFDWLRAVVFQLNLKYLLVKITKPSTGSSINK